MGEWRVLYSVRAEWRRRRGGSVKRLAAYLAIISLHGVKISSSALRCQEIRWGKKGEKISPCAAHLIDDMGGGENIEIENRIVRSLHITQSSLCSHMIKVCNSDITLQNTREVGRGRYTVPNK